MKITACDRCKEKITIWDKVGNFEFCKKCKEAFDKFIEDGKQSKFDL